MFFGVILALTVAFMLYYHYVKKYYTVLDGVVKFPGKFLPIGHIIFVVKHLKDIYGSTTKVGTHCIENGGISLIYLGPYPVYVIGDAEDATIITNKCLEKPEIYTHIKPLFGDMLVAATGQVWKHNRRILDLAFKQPILDSYIKVFSEQALRLVETWRPNVDEYFDATKDITRNVLETTCQTTMGMTTDGADFANDDYVHATETVFEIIVLRILKIWTIPGVLFRFSALKKQFDDSLRKIFDVSEKMVKLRKSEHLQKLKSKSNNNENEFKSYLSIVIENTVTETESVFTDLQLRYLCDNILLAGFDTSTYELLFTLVCIGSDQDFQKKIYDEIISTLGDEEAVTKDHLPKLVNLEAAIKEAIRLYPIGPVVSRKTTTEVELNTGNIKLPPNNLIAIHLWAINRNKKYWGPDADDYRPQRWLDTKTLPAHSNAFSSFSFGRRNCIGKTYAMMYMKSTIALILKKYRVTADHTQMKFDCFIMLKPKGGHLMKLELRQP